jgi:SAM-dependent methyltransferase
MAISRNDTPCRKRAAEEKRQPDEIVETARAHARSKLVSLDTVLSCCRMRDRVDLFVASVLVLFLELASIRWFPAHILFLTFFTNVMLLASFLGISVGCLAARSRTTYLVWTPVLLACALAAAHLIEWERQRTGSAIGVGNPLSPQLVYFGVESQPLDPSTFVVPIEAVSGAMFVLVALVLMGPGQQLGRALARLSNRLEAYTLNIAGSIVGILLFTVCARWQVGPAWWFAAVLAMIAWLLPWHECGLGRIAIIGPTAATVLLLASRPAVVAVAKWVGVAASRIEAQEYWSPYYRIRYEPGTKAINVNLIGHQQMNSRDWPSPAYALPHLWRRDSGGWPFADVLVIGAGSGNDVSRALQWGARSVDAVEIDPVIYGLGQRDHPDRPYANSRVTIHLDDGRNYLRSSHRQYDLIIYALVDSLVLHSSYSNIRLESYLFTTEAFADVKKRLKPGGMFVMYNYFRQGWIVARLNAMLEATFGPGNALVFNLPPKPIVNPDDVLFDEFTMMVAGDTVALREAFARHADYWVRSDQPSDPHTPNGFDVENRASTEPVSSGGQPRWMAFRPTTVVPPSEPLRLPTDAWPFLYLRTPMIPVLSLRGAAVMAAASALLLVPWLRRPRASTASVRTPSALPSAASAIPRIGAGVVGSLSGTHRAWPPPLAASEATSSDARVLLHMFFLGAGFMLIETKAVVQMALLFGSTWTVNAVVFCAVLVMVLMANIFERARPRVSLVMPYAGLLVSLAVSALVPLDAWLGMPRQVQVAGACALAFTPIVFAGVIFARSFRSADDADRAFGANVAGAMVGGLSEYSSMLLGFQYAVLVAAGFYALSAFMSRGRP